MSTDSYLTFKKFYSPEEVSGFGALLKQEHIDYVIEDSKLSFELVNNLNETSQEYRLKIKQEDFERVNQLLLEHSSRQLEHVDKDYYLFEFTDAELMEVITKPDEWNPFDFLLAQKILKERGKEVKPEELETIKQQRTAELSKPDKNQDGWIIAGYITAFFGGLLGIFIGWHLQTHKKTLPNGDRIYAYSESDRKNGRSMFIIGIIFFTIGIIVKFMN
ncbi:MAG: hypothetical protein JWM14_868 [Chitinophagaceae bacterium]|nr:hypothetical protein [Chitinophagaceae bacterium]